MSGARLLVTTLVAILSFATAGCDRCTAGDRRCHPVKEEIEICVDGQWETEEECTGRDDCCMANDDGSGAHCSSECWTTSCETGPIGS